MSETIKSEMAAGVLTDEMIENMRQKIGLKMRLENIVNNELVTKEAIRRFVNGLGDVNPLWQDEEYARKSRYGCLVAPPQWIWTVCAGVQLGWRGLAGFHSATEQEFYKPMLVGDKITPEVIFAGFEGPTPSKFGERMVRDYYDNFYRNQKGELVAKGRWWVHRAERKSIKQKGKHQSIQLPHPWTEEELKKIEDEVLAEEIRGATPRYWEDVDIGEELKPLVKGPLGITDMVARYVGGAVATRLLAHGAALREYRRHPAWAFRDSETYALEPIASVHYNKRAANSQGLPFPYDAGIGRHCWLGHFLTNWMGDDGWLKRCYAEYRAFVFYSDVVWIKGKVSKKYIDEEREHCVDIEISTKNQRGEECMPGRSTISLPSREKGISPLDLRLR
jgi:acyl dehydratase